jgi:hypothetical protein
MPHQLIFHVITHVAFHISFVSTSAKKWSMVDDRVNRIGKTFHPSLRNHQHLMDDGWVDEFIDVFQFDFQRKGLMSNG